MLLLCEVQASGKAVTGHYFTKKMLPSESSTILIVIALSMTTAWIVVVAALLLIRSIASVVLTLTLDGPIHVADVVPAVVVKWSYSCPLRFFVIPNLAL